MNAKISVIVPVYNVEKYLERSVKSIQQQTYSNLQIILVDDGSTDSCAQLCDAFAKQDERIIAVHKVNGGLSSARNYGLEYAKGDIIAFVDSDDYIHPKMYEHMLHVMQLSNADIVMCSFQEVNEENQIYEDISFEHMFEEEASIVEGDMIPRQLKERDVQTVVQWNRLYKKNIFDDIRYPNGRVHEDVFVIHKELWKCKKVAYLMNQYYYYVQRSDSIMHAVSARNLRDTIAGFEDRIRFYEERNCKEAANQAVEMLLMYILWKYESADKGQKEIKKWLKNELAGQYGKYQNNDANIDEYRLPAKNMFLYRIKKKMDKIRKW